MATPKTSVIPLHQKVAFGTNLLEAFDRYVNNIECGLEAQMADNDPSLSKPLAGVTYTAVAVKIEDSYTLELLELVNALNEKWMAECAKFIKERARPETAGLENEQGGKIQLANKHHVSLFYYGRFKKDPEINDLHVREVMQRVDEIESPYKFLLETLTPYEFAVSLLYKHFYNLKYPFEAPDPSPIVSKAQEPTVTSISCCTNPCVQDDNGSSASLSLVPILLKYLISVPNVLLCATVELGRSVVPMVREDGSFQTSTSESGKITPGALLNELWWQCTNEQGVLIEQEHFPHVTLGISKEYKPVLSNDICEAIYNYLAYASSATTTASTTDPVPTVNITKILADSTAEKVDPSCVADLLDIKRTPKCEFGDARQEFISLLPTLLSSQHIEYSNLNDDMLNQNVASVLVPPKVKQRTQTPATYKDTSCFVAHDKSWFYFRKLPVTNTSHVHPNFVVDVYLVPIHKAITGEIQFFEK